MQPHDLTCRQMAGQRIIAGFQGTGINADLKHLIRDLCVGGIILFSRNIETLGQLRRLTADVQKYAKDCGRPQLFVAVDQEGGSVARLKAPDFTEFGHAANFSGKTDAARFARITAAELADSGINMDMAPVMDVADPGIESVMTRRAFGTNPGYVAEMGTEIINGLQKKRIMAVAKHFPGIGRTTLDSHLDLPDLNTPAQSLHARDLVPFQAAVKADAAGIMLSHIRYMAFDRNWPASLSAAVAERLLRAEMGYNGLVMTDDLEMGAVENHYDMETMISQIMAAGIDIALICHSMDKIRTAAQIFEQTIKDENQYRRQTESVSRIFSAKRRYLF
ncbi:beta-N-acetylhexosaminidase [Desulfosalsimonas propionicica]|uniref:beta-N-acetylhexosaminidase n=1 Tax=Desulfosalsimonas propionicica TaxID=332175 RepID=A0A7W0HJY4_9BACT|nr:beta-N-acetylhexosaminidase [Desulfosalsimonas propionicica]MBA2880578.1 beta-N-acetylhexosaminidase [Desulfosalsimonas propionicica]